MEFNCFKATEPPQGSSLLFTPNTTNGLNYAVCNSFIHKKCTTLNLTEYFPYLKKKTQN